MLSRSWLALIWDSGGYKEGGQERSGDGDGTCVILQGMVEAVKVRMDNWGWDWPRLGG